MALVKCPECGNQVSDRASACPKCGYPFRQQEPAQERKKKTPTPPTGLEDSAHMHEVDAKLQAIPETGEVDKLYRISRSGSPDGLRFISSDEKSVYLECASCGKLLRLRKDLFESVDCDGCSSLIAIACPRCASSKRGDAGKQSKGHPHKICSQGKVVATGGTNGCLGFIVLGIVAFFLFSLAKCSGMFDAPSSSHYSDDYQNDSMSAEDAIEEELGHYNYDEFGHLEDDRNSDRF